MSKQSEAKAKQGWRKKPNMCADCAHFTSQKTEEKYSTWTWTKESFLRCSLGDFKTGKSNTCDRFSAKPDAQ
ncbi:hypothetical protein C7S15_1611 [Burkholderia cepacia]|uniref:hypothetical protein n=1 Tax=Burkholderia cepacia TaxID=292 RepID=UPI00298FD863|nr:hypothetical protein [Burkholderia cepacia]MDW9227044.1 hypothetical protein [Burkholderia cepacia]